MYAGQVAEIRAGGRHARPCLRIPYTMGLTNAFPDLAGAAAF
jgi:hypothetical protein